jgi:hypothetical protein
VRDCREAGHVGVTWSCTLAAATEAAAISDGLYCKRTIRQNKKSSASGAVVHVGHTQIFDSCFYEVDPRGEREKDFALVE